ncbi:MAG: hypothetical protein P8X70_02310 [Nanoarchaeota archaeon]|jgi:hypothetical protein
MFKIDEKYFKKRKKQKLLNKKVIFLTGVLLGYFIFSGIDSCIDNYQNSSKSFYPEPVYKDINEDGLEDKVYLRMEFFQ